MKVYNINEDDLFKLMREMDPDIPDKRYIDSIFDKANVIPIVKEVPLYEHHIVVKEPNIRDFFDKCREVGISAEASEQYIVYRIVCSEQDYNELIALIEQVVMVTDV